MGQELTKQESPQWKGICKTAHCTDTANRFSSQSTKSLAATNGGSISQPAYL